VKQRATIGTDDLDERHEDAQRKQLAEVDGGALIGAINRPRSSAAARARTLGGARGCRKEHRHPQHACRRVLDRYSPARTPTKTSTHDTAKNNVVDQLAAARLDQQVLAR
jgi:hypothetical protein